MNKDVLEQAIIRLLNSQSFYAHLMMQFVRIKTDKTPTAGVTIRGASPILYYNEEWLKNCPSDEFRKEVLIHECGHIIRDHIGRKKNISGSEENQAFHNVCMDLAINCYLPELTNYSNENPEGKYSAVTIEKMEKELGIQLEQKQTYEYYVEQLRPHAEEIGKQYNSLDSHDQWGEPGDTTEQLKDLVRKAMARSAGSIPRELKGILDELLKSEVDWQKQLRLFANTVKSREKERTRKKYNRRYGLLNPGRRRKDTTKIAVAVDTSGSMWDLLPKAMAEVYEIAKHSEVWIIECDAEVKACYKADPKKPQDFSGCGGTVYQPAIDKAVEIGASGLIYLGDMDACDTGKLQKPPFKVLWGIFGNSQAPAEWGKTLRIGD